MMRERSTLLLPALVAMALASACSGPGVEIYAPPEFAEGTVLIDGAAVAQLSKPQHDYRWTGWKNLKDELSGPPRHETSATISELSAGVHVVSLTKGGYIPLTARVDYEPGKRTKIDLSSAEVRQAPAVDLPKRTR